VIDEPSVITPKKKVAAQQIISSVLAISALVVSVMFYQSESAYHQLLMFPKIQSREQIQPFTEASRKPLSYGFTEPTFVFTYARNLAEIGNFDGAKLELIKLIKSDSKNYEAFRLLSEIDEYLKDWNDAIVLRQQMMKLDPYNQVNLLQLGTDEKNLGNLTAAQAIIPLINAFAPNSQEAKHAQTDFGK
jgi:predicted Zn-dependent protease